ncbi:MAG TPA: type II toxin-antitoxin system VapC family toxin [Candidatus Sulfotelmatobacter sp.]|nr:type II toxin-antitoxin system VapC family toxin [Candidatus Sulfotelmatobacter sp.]
MIVDASAVITILRAEPEAPAMARALDREDSFRISVVNYVEAAIVIDAGRDPIASRRFDDFCRETPLIIEPVTVEQGRVAREAYRDFGKGRHRAGLNLGDCFAYALARVTGEPLLFKGGDFGHTDIEPVER